jgi:tetratricopeptide (TPR) repeat protein
VLAVVTAAAEGLAAAHAAGLVHRDFKPDNAILGDDGRVRVVDFGLARAIEGRASDGSPEVDSAAACVDVGFDTTVGTIAGTPAYMAPEQHAGRDVGPAADQFALCVTLWEGLYGQRPYDGTSLAELVAQVMDGRRRTPPRDASVPTWLRRAIERGLAPRPEDRFASMSELIGVLERGRRPARRRVVLGGAAVLVAATAWLARDRSRDPCGELPSSRWDAATQQDIERAFLATEAAYAADTWVRAREVLDHRASALAQEEKDLCAAREGATISDPDYHRAMACIAEGGARFDAAIASFAAADADVVAHAVPVSETLRTAAPCRSSIGLEEHQRGPDRSAELASARVLVDLGRTTEARRALASAKASVELPAAELLELEGEVLLAESEFQAALASFRGAFLDELGRGHPRAETAMQLGVVAIRLSRRDEALQWTEMARALLLRRGEDRISEVRLLLLAGQIALEAGDHPLARAYALRAAERADPDDVAGLVSATSLRAVVVAMRGDHEEAVEAFREVLDIQQRRLGPDHPRVADAALNLGVALTDLPDLVGAQQQLERALAVYGTLSPRQDETIATIRYSLAVVLRLSGEPSAARPHLDHALDVWTRTLGPRHPRIAAVESELGILLASSGEVDAGLDRLGRARAILEEAGGEHHPDLIPVLVSSADALHAAGRDSEAIPVYTRAVDLCGRHASGLAECVASSSTLAKLLAAKP